MKTRKGRNGIARGVAGSDFFCVFVAGLRYAWLFIIGFHQRVRDGIAAIWEGRKGWGEMAMASFYDG